MSKKKGYYCCENWEILEDEFIDAYSDPEEFAYEIKAIKSKCGNPYALIRFCPWCGKRLRRMPWNSKERPYPKYWEARIHLYVNGKHEC